MFKLIGLQITTMLEGVNVPLSTGVTVTKNEIKRENYEKAFRDRGSGFVFTRMCGN